MYFKNYDNLYEVFSHEPNRDHVDCSFKALLNIFYLVIQCMALILIPHWCLTGSGPSSLPLPPSPGREGGRCNVGICN
jgi:hypothetical protein